MDFSWTSGKPGEHYFVSDDEYSRTTSHLFSLSPYGFEEEINAKHNPMEEFECMLTNINRAHTETTTRVVYGPPIDSMMDTCVFVDKYKNRWDVYHATQKSEKEMFEYITGEKPFVQYTCKTDRLCQMFGEEIHTFVALICDALQVDTKKDEYNVLLRYMSTVCRNGRLDSSLAKLRPIISAKGNRTMFDLQKAIDVIVAKNKHDKTLFPLVEKIRNLVTLSTPALWSVMESHVVVPAQTSKSVMKIIMENDSKVLVVIDGSLHSVSKRTMEVEALKIENGIVDAAVLGSYCYAYTEDNTIVSNNPLWEVVNATCFSSCRNAIGYVAEGNEQTLSVVKYTQSLTVAEFPLQNAIVSFNLSAVAGNYVHCEINGDKTVKSIGCQCNGQRCSKCTYRPPVVSKASAQIVNGILLLHYATTNTWKTVKLVQESQRRCQTCGVKINTCTHCSRCKDTHAVKFYIAPKFQKNAIVVGDYVRFENGDGYVTDTYRRNTDVKADIDVWHLDKVGVTCGKKTTASLRTLQRIYRGNSGTIYVWEKDQPFLMNVQIHSYLSHANKYVAGVWCGAMHIKFELEAEEILQFRPLEFIRAIRRGRNMDNAHRDYALTLMNTLNNLQDASQLWLANFHIEDSIVSENLRDLYSENPHNVREMCIMQHRRKISQLRRTLRCAIEQHNKKRSEQAACVLQKAKTVPEKPKKRKREADGKQKKSAKLSFLERLKNRNKQD